MRLVNLCFAMAFVLALKISIGNSGLFLSKFDGNYTTIFFTGRAILVLDLLFVLFSSADVSVCARDRARV